MRGMTWNHPRGYEPLEAATRLWVERGFEDIDWDRRSLQDFESVPVEELARRYDLIIIDHPHVGEIADSGCLVPFDAPDTAAALAALAAGSVGGSYESYTWRDRQWALPVDAAAQVQAWVPTRIEAPADNWPLLMAIAREKRVALPLRPPHSLMSLFTLCGLIGVRLDPAAEALFPQAAEQAYERLAALAALVDPASYEADPITVLEEMARADSRLAVAPLIYGYVSYALDGFRPARIAFGNLPAADPRGSALGGTGIAVSAFGTNPQAARDFALWVASGPVQRELYAMSGGQPGHAEAWDDAAVNAPVADFYRATRATLDRAWLRPRHHGYMAFQHAASVRLNEALLSNEPAASAIAALNALDRRHR